MDSTGTGAEGGAAVAQAERLTFRHLLAEAPTIAEITVEIERGERALLLGPSGSGKSTLALLFNGLIPRSSGGERGGSLFLFGEDPAQAGPAHMSRRIGIVFQNPESQFCTLRVDDEIAFGLENVGTDRDAMDRRIDSALERVGMLEHRRRRLDRLSGGMKQRVAIASVLVMEPELLILDEPTAHLDPEGTRSVVDLVRSVSHGHAGTTLLLIEHRVDAWLSLVGRVLALDSTGHLIADGTPRDVYAAGTAATDNSPEADNAVWRPAAIEVSRFAARRGVRLDGVPLMPDELLSAARRHGELRSCALSWARSQRIAGDDSPGGGAPADIPENDALRRLELQAVTYRYGDGTEALSELTLNVGPGEIVGVTGNNGSGKSTLAYIATGLRAPTAGTVSVDGKNFADIAPRELSAHCGHVFQNPEHQFVADSVFEEVAFSLRKSGLANEELTARTAELLNSFGLEEKDKANPFELSQGEKRRLSVAAMLAPAPPLLVLDEPTFGQDVRAIAELAHLFRQLADDGTSLLLVSHDVDLLWRIADRVALLRAGTLISSGPTRAVLADAALMGSADLDPPFPARILAELEQE